MPADPGAETRRLRTGLRDLVAFSAIPAIWVGRDPQSIVAGFVDVLATSLRLDFAFVRLHDPERGVAAEATQGSAWRNFAEWLRHRLTVAGRLSRGEIVPDLGDGAEPCRGILIPIGVDAEGGWVAAASARIGFPDEIDQLLLSVAANQAATAFHSACLAHELRKGRDDLEARVAARTADLQRSETYLAEAQRLSRTGSWAWDPRSHKVLYLSEEMFRISGLDPQERGLTIEQALRPVHPEDRDRVEKNIETMLREKVDSVDEYRIVLPDGAVKHIQIVRHLVLNDVGDIVEVVGTVADVTERKRAEEGRERLRQLEADLAHINRVSMMGELTASLTHELKQPIGAAVINAGTCLRWLTRDEPDLEEAREAARRIISDGTRAAEIITRLRSFYAKQPPQREAIDVNDVVREMLALLRHEAARHGVSLRADLEADLSTVTADRVQLQQVFMNLMLNGIEAMTDIPGELLIASTCGEDGHVVASVTDGGVGLPPDRAEQIYDAFFTTKPQGTGMGLTIARSIVESHGGRLWATQNDSGRGTTFSFSLPVGGA